MTINVTPGNPTTVEAVSNTTTTSNANALEDFNTSIIGKVDSGVTVDGFGLQFVSTSPVAGTTIAITNDGTVSTDQNSSQALSANAGPGTNFGDFTYSGAGDVTNTGTGGDALSITNPGAGNVDITVSGTSTISASSTGTGIEASNNGTGTVKVTVQSGGTVEGGGAVSFGNGVDTLDNSGTLQGIGDLGVGASGSVATVNNFGTITGTAQGVAVDNVTLTNNSGGMIETAGTTATGAAEAAIVAVSALTAADITNKSGATIQATGPLGQIGILIGNTDPNTGAPTATGAATVDNAGTISGPFDGINTSTTGTTTITNSGSITATARSGIRVDTASIENDKGGSVSGLNGIFFRNDPTLNQVFAASTVFNDGTITGTGATAGFGATPIAIHFSAGSTGNTLTLGTDSVINGNVLGAGSDILQLGGTGSASFDVSNIGAAAQYQGFSTFNKIDTSTWTLTGTGTDGWTVEQGTLQVDGTIGDTTVESGGTLDGIGTTGALTVDSGGTLAPGDDPGTITTGNLDLQSGSALSIGIEGASPGVGGFAQVVVNGSVTLAGTLSASLLKGFTPSAGETFEIIDNDSNDPINGTFATLGEGASFTVGSTTFSISYVGGDGNDVVLTAGTTAPTSLSGQTVLNSATEGSLIASGTPVATFTDSNTSDTANSFAASIAWGDGTTDTGPAVTIVGSNGSFTVEGSHTYADEGNEPLSVTLTRTSDNATATATGSITVGDADSFMVSADNFNANPGVAINKQVATFTDAFAGQVAGDLAATIMWGDGTSSTGTVSETAGTFTVTGSHTYAAGGKYSFNVSVDDPGGAGASAPGMATINFAGQEVLAHATEGTALPNNTPVATFSDSDSSDAAASFTAMIEWGDGATSSGTVSGTSATPGGTTTFTVSGGHTYADEGNDTATVILTHTADQSTSTVSGAVTVAEADVLVPHGTSFTANAHQVFTGTVATFDDTGFPGNVAGDFTASIDWGDNQTTTGSVSGGNGSAFTVTGSHVYAAAGQDTVKVKLADDAPGTATATATTTATVNQGAAIPFDLNGNAISDLVFQNNGTPGIWLWNGSAPTAEVALTNPGASWHIITSHDVNGDGKADLIWQNNDGTPGIWLMNGTTPTAEVGLTNPGPTWKLVAAGDVNGDGNADLIWRDNSGTLGVWEMNGTTPIAEAAIGNPGANWKVVGTADYNGDTNDDILLQDTNTGNLKIDFMNGTSIASTVSITVGDPSWHAVSTGEFNGQAEIAWQNNNGTAGIWLMNGTAPAAEAALSNPGAGWQLVSIDHFTPNGQADLLFQNTAGPMMLWEMNGTNVAAMVNTPNPTAAWQSVNGHPFAAG